MADIEASSNSRERLFHRLFRIGIWLKGIDGILELIGGVLFLIVSPQALNHYVIVLTQHDLHDWLGDALRHWSSQLHHSSKLIGGAYLLGNGVVKVFLAVGILRGKLWCYPTAIIILSIFVCLQIARLIEHFSFLMLTGAGIDTLIILLILREYRHIKSHAR